VGGEAFLTPFIAESPVMKEKIRLLERIAKTDSSILILGESGVGKELAAEKVHYSGARASGPFVKVNCAALPEELAESELFGHVKGAFTGADANRKGRFETAAGGTIFLDEVADLTPALQAKVLRVIDEKVVYRLGQDVPVSVDVRIVAATNRDLEDMAEKGEFRRDLFFRLNVLPVYIPPLRQRREDIAPLADMFLRRYAKQNGKAIDGFTEEARLALFERPWPGNVREMGNAVERACAISGGGLIELWQLFPSDGAPGDGAYGCEGGSLPGNLSGNLSLKSAIDAFKKRYITKVLESRGWNRTAAARILDVERTYLSRLIRELNIKP
jgi:Nif-specific regulatory protein